ncbi:ThrRS/AlaRS common domain-containing protein, partial [Aureobasidium melanogenum]
MSTRTVLAFQHDAKLYTLPTTVVSITPFKSLDEANQQLFKTSTTEADYVVVTRETIFHPQGGGQPSDTGTMKSLDEKTTFSVSAVRMDCVHDGEVLHLGRFDNETTSDKVATTSFPSPSSPSSSSTPPLFNVGETITQSIDIDKRILYSRLHTAGHVLGAAVRHLLEPHIADFDELKASHFPDSAACEFKGLIEGKWKADIQTRVDEYVARALPVQVDFWTEEDFRDRGLERLIPSPEAGRLRLAPGEKYRVVKIVGAEVYPCGGTHVDSTDLCGKVGVKKISRNKGTSRVSYTVA